jgi:transcriptional regulator with XRE-family HTH domain
MTGNQVKQTRLRLNLTQEELGVLLAVSGNTVARWERGEVAPPGMLRLAFRALELEAAAGNPQLLRQERQTLAQGADNRRRVDALAQAVGAGTSAERERRRVKHRRDMQRDIRDLAAKLGFESANLYPAEHD